MQEMTLAHYWMAGIMIVMVIFAGIALNGFRLQQKREQDAAHKSNKD